MSASHARAIVAHGGRVITGDITCDLSRLSNAADFAADGRQVGGNSMAGRSHRFRQSYKVMEIDVNEATVPVLIAGGGPVGLVTALELAFRGIRSILVERNVTTTVHPKMDVTNGRSMEHFRRLGVAEKIRDAAVPRENCMDVIWVTRLGEWEVARFRYPDVHEVRELIRLRNDGTQPLEPYMRMSQIALEPLLKSELEKSPYVDVRFGWDFESFEQDADGVTATIRSDDGKLETVRCQYLAGCDGGSSKVREGLGVTCEGSWNAARFFMVHFRTPEGPRLQKMGIAWHYQSPVGGTLIAQNDVDVFTLHCPVPPGMDEAKIDPQQLLFDGLGMEFECEILQANAWSPHLVVAESYGEGRVWLAGDSAHQYIPTGGYGMNTGVCDGIDIAWKYAAVLEGWGGPGLLESIDAERRPVALENRDAAGRNMAVRIQIAEACDPVMHEASEAGAAARSALGRLILDLGNAENEALGIEIGYRYRNSPIICHEDDEPEWRLCDYVPSTWPGVRAPHIFLNDGSAIFDSFGAGFTLLRFANTDVGGMVDAAVQRGVPLKVVDIRDDKARQIYERDLVLVRPDQHVAWRANACPDDALAIIDKVRGA